MVVDRHREHALGLFLTDHVIVENVADLLRRGDAAILLADERRLGLFANDVVAELDTFVADEHGRSGDELAHLVLRLAAERAIERALGVAAAELGHSIHPLRAGRVASTRHPTRGFPSGNP
jgi:hypothetical protein